MPKRLIIGFLSVAGLALVSCGSGSPTAPSGTDLFGVWACSKSSDVVSGPCVPAHVDESGTCTFTGSGTNVTLTLSNGFACAPAAACTLSCTGTTSALACNNSGIADSSGGQYGDALAFTLISDKRAVGAGTATYTHAIQCQWQVQLTLTRS